MTADVTAVVPLRSGVVVPLGQMRRSAAVSAVLLSLGLTTARSAVADGKAEPEETAAPPVTGLDLRVREHGPGRPWTMELANRGEDGAWVAADPRLLWFDVQVPGKKKKTTCKLPSELFPKHADARTLLLLDPGEGVEQRFDPRLFCFDAGGQWQLVPGALVTPHFGWPEKKKTVWKHGKRVEETPKQSPPFVAKPATEDGGGKSDESNGLKQLDAEPFALRSDYAEWSRTKVDADKKPPDDTPLEMTTVQGSDAEAERNATVRITLKNRSKHSVTVYFRRELVSYEVMRPDGLATCDPQPDLRAPDRQGFTHIGAGHSITVVSRLVEMCPTGTFGQPGLYLVHARFDANEAGDEWDMDAFVGRVLSHGPATVRIRTGEQPFLQKRRLYRVKVSDAKK
jgi:hypothetical protein